MSTVSMPTARGSLPILMYHSISPTTTPGFHKFTVTPAVFEEHLAALHDDGWKTLTFTDAAVEIEKGVLPHPKTVVITVDDGFDDFYRHALPMLARHRMPATIFVPTAYVGASAGWLTGLDADRRLLSWNALREIASTGIEVGSHGHRHAPLDVTSDAELFVELHRSRSLLQDQLAVAADTLAYPYGYHTRRARRMALRAGYTAACGVVGLLATHRDRILAIPRLAMSQDLDGAALIRVISANQGRMERHWRRGKQHVWRLGRAVAAAHRNVSPFSTPKGV